MTTRPRALGALILTLALVAALMVPALAATTASYDGPGRGATISGTAPGTSQTSWWAGEMEMTLEGGQEATGFCVDILTSISPMGGLAEQDWETSGISNLDKITYILQNYDVDDSSALSGNANRRAASIQAAIWHFSDGFELTSTNGALRNNYDDIIDDANANAGAPQPSPSLDIDPASATAYAGQQAGPFVVTTTGSNVPLNLDVPAAQAVDSNGAEITHVDDGDQFWVTSPEAGDVEVSASVTATIEAGRVFAAPGVQRLILATSGEATSTASATATFTPLSTGEPVDPTIEGSDECGVPDKLTIPTTQGVQYLHDGETIEDGTVLEGPLTGTITATALEGYELDDADWEFEFELAEGEPCPEEVTPIAPDIDRSDECDVPDSLTVPTTEGIEYQIDGIDVSGTTITGPNSGTLVAVATDGYVLDAPWSYEFDLDGADTCATAVTPRVQTAEECGVSNTLTIPETDGVQYLLDGDAIADGTVLEGPLTGTLTATALDGYALTNPEWEYDVDLDAAEPCPDPVVAPAATITAECTDDEGMSVAVTLDNSDSEEEVSYLVSVAGNVTEVDVAAGETTTVDAEVAAGTGEYDVDVEAAGVTLASETFDTSDCETEVAGVVIEADDEDETDDDEVETEVLDVELEAEDDELPVTGISALMLVLLGLFGITAGGTLVRRRR